MFYIMRSNLLNRLVELRESDNYPFHMPGHKRRSIPEFGVTTLDITEIDGFDNLYAAEGILEQCMQRAAGLYGSKKALLGVNGSTGNLLAAISAAFHPGEAVLVARNCHKAVYHALELRRLKPVFLYPETDSGLAVCKGITLREVKAFLEEYEASTEGKESPVKGMILTSPTYEGIVSQIKEIADFLHQKDAVLVVDEAHGAHFGFHASFPESAIGQGADLVIQSLHKTLPALTQTSLLHIVTDRVCESLVEKYWGMYQTSSPSYILMASMDECFEVLTQNGKILFDEYDSLLKDFYQEAENLTHLKVMNLPDKDPGKIVISVPESISALDVYETLRNEYHLQPEMCGLHHVLMMTSLYDTKEGFERLKQALWQIDATYRQIPDGLPHADAMNLHSEVKETCEAEGLKELHGIKLRKRMFPYETERVAKESVFFADCEGEISAEYLYLYPPGIPYIIPGEEIPAELIKALEHLQKKGYRLLGNERENRLLVVRNPKNVCE